MADYVLPLQRLIEQFRKLPGVGNKSAVRMAFSVLNLPPEEIEEFADALLSVRQSIHTCKICCNLSEGEICEVCADEDRQKNIICVVEQPKDVMAVERIRAYRGQYHVLGGVLSPMNGIGPEQLHFHELLTRVQGGEVDEVIVATNPSVEGEATAMYLARLLSPLGIKVSRLAYGIPVGGELEYADEITLRHAIEGRSLLS